MNSDSPVRMRLPALISASMKPPCCCEPSPKMALSVMPSSRYIMAPASPTTASPGSSSIFTNCMSSPRISKSTSCMVGMVWGSFLAGGAWGWIRAAASVGYEEAVLLEQGFEAIHPLQVLGAETVVETAEVALHLLDTPAGAGLAAGHFGERCQPGGERRFEEGAEVALERGLERRAHRPHGVDERQPGPFEPIG